ncbi:Beta-glucanase [Stackebrandtia soli]
MYARSIRTRAVPLVFAIAAVLVATLSPQANADAPDANIREVVWSDEFDGAPGTPPNPANWTHEVNGDGGGNAELQYYTNSTDNAALDGNGNLVITARRENPADYQCHYGRCEYTSARLITADKFTRQYGHFEARIKVPVGQGIWPAFWMLGENIRHGVPWPDCGEIDIMENIGSQPSTVHGSLHGPGYSGGSPLTGSYTLPNGERFTDGFHTFAVDWTPDHIAWSIDGVEYSRKTPADAGGNPWPFHQPFFIIINLAVGGHWPGPPDGSTQFPQSMVIDYIRVSA